VNKYLKTMLVAALPLLVVAGCNDFLKCDECVTTPNDPTTATLQQRFEAIATSNTTFQEGDLARLISMWMQSMSGTTRQYVSLGTYVISESDEDGAFQTPYTGGGLVDLRALEAGATAANDQKMLGVAQVLEAWMIGTAADIWGDIPYSQAAKPDSFPTPELDAQQDVYAQIQALLSQAITNMGGSGSGPQGSDLVYGGDMTKWIALAHTLKARYYLHTAEVVGAEAYQNALTEAQAGISSNAGDYLSARTTKTGEDNLWEQFILVQRQGYISAGKFLVDLLTANNDPRLADYFAPGDTAIPPSGAQTDTIHPILGAAPGEENDKWMANLNPETRLRKDYPQPDVTYNENLLIQAEAQFNLDHEPEALALLNQEIASWNTATPWHNADSVAAVPDSTSGPALLQAIMTEKYIALFQNIEVWNDYKRTCIPALTPAGGAAEIPARLFYGTTERQTNPNIPDVTAQQAHPHNWNDPNGCSHE
jgi:hypothetical protein